MTGVQIFITVYKVEQLTYVPVGSTRYAGLQ
jgi:hypothetical protein